MDGGSSMRPSQKDRVLHGLPCEAMIRQGLQDVEEGKESVAASLVNIARPRLEKAELLRRSPAVIVDAELLLYKQLAYLGDRAYSRYKSLVRELISFEKALDFRLRQ